MGLFTALSEYKDMRVKGHEIMRIFLKFTAVILIGIFSLPDCALSVNAGNRADFFEKSPKVMLSARICLDSFPVRQAFDLTAGQISGTQMLEQGKRLRNSLSGQGLRAYWKKCQASFYLFLLSKLDNPYIRRIICRRLIKLNSDYAFRYLRRHALTAQVRINESNKPNLRMQMALIELTRLNKQLAGYLGVKKKLFAQVKSEDTRLRNRAFALLEYFDITSDEGLDNIVEWIKSKEYVFLLKAAQQINRFGKRRLEKLKNKGAVKLFVAATEESFLIESGFIDIVQALKNLGAKEDGLIQVYINCFKNPQNGVFARKKAAELLGEVKDNRRKAVRFLLNHGLTEGNPMVRCAVIKTLGNLGKTKAIKALEQLLKDTLAADNQDMYQEALIIEEAIEKLKSPVILGMYDPITRKHVSNAYELAKILAVIYKLNPEESRLLKGAVLKHDLGKSRKGYYDVVVIPKKLTPGDDMLEKFRIEHSFISDNLLEEYQIETSIKEHLLVRNHHRPDILGNDPDYTALPEDEQMQVRKILEMLMVIDSICGYTETFRPPNWFDNISFNADNFAEIFKSRYEKLGYEFILNIKEMILSLDSNAKAQEIIEANSRHDPFLIAYAMNSWINQRDYYLELLKERVADLKETDINVVRRFLTALSGPVLDKALNGKKKRAREIFCVLIDGLLENKAISHETAKHIRKLVRKYPDCLFCKIAEEYSLEKGYALTWQGWRKMLFLNLQQKAAARYAVQSKDKSEQDEESASTELIKNNKLNILRLKEIFSKIKSSANRRLAHDGYSARIADVEIFGSALYLNHNGWVDLSLISNVDINIILRKDGAGVLYSKTENSYRELIIKMFRKEFLKYTDQGVNSVHESADGKKVIINFIRGSLKVQLFSYKPGYGMDEEYLISLLHELLVTDERAYENDKAYFQKKSIIFLRLAGYPKWQEYCEKIINNEFNVTDFEIIKAILTHIQREMIQKGNFIMTSENITGTFYLRDKRTVSADSAEKGQIAPKKLFVNELISQAI
ncbi:MAG: HEAT repeat domain-containing protein [Candidatus Omnitrophica bacterium]|nr:HEAT repeat domain-containing protein [Candidatus Omnitrophota bacterium]